MLYRKWRPRTFAEVVGQGHVVQTLQNALASGRVAHAYLFAGPRGTGKTTCARLLAKAVNCLGPEDNRPCGDCAICRAVDEGRLLDLIEIDAASNTGVDDVRELQERVGFQPAQAKYKVYIVDEVHMLSTAAFNALLKTLEEPPPHVIFILATTEPHKLPATVVSRCQRFAFCPISEANVAGQLARVAEAEGMEADPEALALIARHATGALRDGLSLLEQVAGGGPVTLESVRQVLGLVPEEGTLAVLDAVAAGDVGGALGALSALLDGGADVRVVRRQLVDQLRYGLVVAAGVKMPAPGSSKAGGAPPRLESLAGVGVERLLGWLSALVEGKPHAADDRTGLELALVRAVIGLQSPAASGLATVLSDAVQPACRTGRGEPIVHATPRSPRQVTASPSHESRRDPSTERPTGADEQPRREETGDEAVVSERQPPACLPAAQAGAGRSPTLPRTLDALAAHWEDVLAQVRQTGDTSIQALLRSCRPVAVDDRQVVIAARYGFHRSRLESEEVRRAVEHALVALIGEPVALQVVLAEEDPAPAQKTNRGDGNVPAGLPPQLADDPLVRVAVQELGAVVRIV